MPCLRPKNRSAGQDNINIHTHTHTQTCPAYVPKTGLPARITSTYTHTQTCPAYIPKTGQPARVTSTHTHTQTFNMNAYTVTHAYQIPILNHTHALATYEINVPTFLFIGLNVSLRFTDGFSWALTGSGVRRVLSVLVSTVAAPVTVARKNYCNMPCDCCSL